MKTKSLRLSLIVALPLCALVVGVLVLRSAFGVALAKEPALSVAAAWPPIHNNLSNTSTKFSRGTGFDSNGSDIVAVWAEGVAEGDTYNGLIRMAWTGKTRPGWTRDYVYNDSGFVGLSPSVAVVDTQAHFCWVAKVANSEQYRVMYRTLDLTTGGFSLSEAVYPASGWTSGESLGAARIAVDSNGLAHLIWVRTYEIGGEERDRIYYSNREGGSWSAATRISGNWSGDPPGSIDSNAYSEDMPALVARGRDIYASWREKSAGDVTWGLYIRHRDPDAAAPLGEWQRWSLGAPTQPLGYRLSGDKYDEFPSMAAAVDRVYVMWDRYLGQECDTLGFNCYQVYSMTYRVHNTDATIDTGWSPSDGSANITVDGTSITATSSITTPLNPQTGQPNLLPPGDVPSPEGYFSGARPSIEVVSAGGVYTPYVVWHHWENEGHRSDIVNPSEPFQIRGAYAEGMMIPGQESWEYLSDEQGGVMLALGVDGTFASPYLALTTGTGGAYDVHVALNVRLGDEGSPWDVLYTNLDSYTWSYQPLVLKGHPSSP